MCDHVLNFPQIRLKLIVSDNPYGVYPSFAPICSECDAWGWL
jgi:hypothetical protein